jgi:hypothetical protein
MAERWLVRIDRLGWMTGLAAGHSQRREMAHRFYSRAEAVAAASSQVEALRLQDRQRVPLGYHVQEG